MYFGVQRCLYTLFQNHEARPWVFLLNTNISPECQPQTGHSMTVGTKIKHGYQAPTKWPNISPSWPMWAPPLMTPQDPLQCSFLLSKKCLENCHQPCFLAASNSKLNLVSLESLFLNVFFSPQIRSPNCIQAHANTPLLRHPTIAYGMQVNTPTFAWLQVK